MVLARPEAFSPGNDGVNDLLYPIQERINGNVANVLILNTIGVKYMSQQAWCVLTANMGRRTDKARDS